MIALGHAQLSKHDFGDFFVNKVATTRDLVVLFYWRLTMTTVRLSSRILYLFACGLLVFILHASAIAQAEASPQANRTVIRVWTVGSPHTNALPEAAVPTELQRRAESLGYKIEVETFRPAGFAARFRKALDEHNEPEVLTFDNYGIVLGIRTSQGLFEGLTMDPRVAPSVVLVHEALAPLQKIGWVMLVRSAVNYEAAKVLSMQPPVCDSQTGPNADAPALQPELRLAQEKAGFVTRAYLDCDLAALSTTSDDSRLGRECFLPESDVKVQSVKPCRVSGNRNLAFVSLVSNFSAQRRGPVTNRELVHSIDLGQKTFLAVLRNQASEWRLLAITDDPLNTVARRPLTTHSVDRAFDDGQTLRTTPEPARLLTPDAMRLPNTRPFFDLTWLPSPTPEVIGQVVEFMWGKDRNWGLTRLFFLPPGESKLSSGHLMNSGATVWRVWSITKAGDVSFSEQHTFKN